MVKMTFNENNFLNTKQKNLEFFFTNKLIIYFNTQPYNFKL